MKSLGCLTPTLRIVHPIGKALDTTTFLMTPTIPSLYVYSPT